MSAPAHILITILRNLGTTKEAGFLKALSTGFGRGRQLNEALQTAKIPAFSAFRGTGALNNTVKNLDNFSNVASKITNSPFQATNPLAFRTGQAAGGLVNIIANPKRTASQFARASVMPGLAAGAGYTGGNINGNIEGSASTLDYMINNPLKTTGLGLASTFGQGHRAVSNALQGKIQDPNTDWMTGSFLRSLLARIQSLQPSPGPTS